MITSRLPTPKSITLYISNTKLLNPSDSMVKGCVRYQIFKPNGHLERIHNLSSVPNIPFHLEFNC
jgi:hypothetical protein